MASRESDWISDMGLLDQFRWNRTPIPTSLRPLRIRVLHKGRGACQQEVVSVLKYDLVKRLITSEHHAMVIPKYQNDAKK